MEQELTKRICCTVVAAFLLLVSSEAAIRDGGIDPANLGKGDWIFSVRDATNRMGGHVPGVTNLTSLMQFYKSQDIRYIVVKAATSDYLYNGCQPGPQFNTALVRAAQTNGIFIFGYNRSYGSNILGEIAISDYVFQQGADGFVWDAEAEWETSRPWITNGPAQAWTLCSAVRSNWPTKFLAHSPFAIISVHSSFPYKEFGYWCDAVMPQIYHFGAAGITNSPTAAINWTDVNWHKWQNDMRALPPSVINGTTVHWTNAIKPIAPIRDVYGLTGSLACNGTAGNHPDRDVMEFMDYLSADPHAATAAGYNGVSFFRSDLHSVEQWLRIKNATIGQFSGRVNNIILDDSRAFRSAGWLPVRTFAATLTSPTFYGATGTDTNSFGTNYIVKGRGTGAAYVEFTPNILVPGEYEVLQWHPYRVNASTNVPFIITHANGTNTVAANQKTNDGNWSSLGRYWFDAGTQGRIQITDGFSELSGIALVDAIKLAFVSPITVPGSPTGLAATSMGASRIHLSWNQVATNHTGYIVSRRPATGGPYTNIAFLPRTVSSFTNSGLPPGTGFLYFVRATNFLGNSLASNIATAGTPDKSGEFTSITVAPGPRIQLTGTGENAAYSVESSTNLVQWTTATNFVNSNGNFSYAEPITNSQRKFFRLRLSD